MYCWASLRSAQPTELPMIEDDFRWNVVELLVKSNPEFCRAFLKKMLTDGNEQEKLQAADYLIELQDLEGLQHYVEWMNCNKRFPDSRPCRVPLQSLQILESLPLLIQLLRISYRKDFVQDEFHPLNRIVLEALTKVALQSDKSYVEVKVAIEDFIRQYYSVFEDINYLYVFLEKFEQKYYITKSEKLTVNDVVEILERYCGYYFFRNPCRSVRDGR